MAMPQQEAVNPGSAAVYDRTDVIYFSTGFIQHFDEARDAFALTLEEAERVVSDIKRELDRVVY